MSLNLLKSRLSGRDRVGFIGNLNPSTIHTLQPRDGGNWRIRFSDKLSCIWVPPCGRRWMRLVINVKLLRDQGRFLLFRRRIRLSLSFSFLYVLFIRSTSFHFSSFNIVFIHRSFQSLNAVIYATPGSLAVFSLTRARCRALHMTESREDSAVPLTRDVLYLFLMTETALLKHIKSYHDKVIQMNQLDATMICWSIRSIQHVSGNILPIIRSVRLRYLQHMVYCKDGYRENFSVYQFLHYTICCKYLSLTLLMMGKILPETCWADLIDQ